MSFKFTPRQRLADKQGRLKFCLVIYTYVSVYIWGGLLGSTILGPVLYSGVLTGESYYGFLRNILEDFLDDLNSTNQQGIFYQQDDASSHNTRNVNNLLEHS